MNLVFSPLVLFLLFLKGLCVRTDAVFFPPGSVCAPAGSDVALGSRCFYPGWMFQAWKLRRNNTVTLADPSKDSRYRYSKDLLHRCHLAIRGLRETDAGTYYMSFIYRGIISFTSDSQSEFSVHVTDLQVSVDSDHVTEGQNVTLTCETSCPPKQTFVWFKNGLRLDLRDRGGRLRVSAANGEDSGRYSCALERFEAFPSVEAALGVSHEAYESAGIIALSSLLILVVLLLVCAALWMIRATQQNLKRREGKEQSKQNENVYANESTLPVTFDLEEKVKSVHREEEVQYSCVHFSKFTNTECSSTCEKEADVQYAQISVQHHTVKKNP